MIKANELRIGNWVSVWEQISSCSEPREIGKKTINSITDDIPDNYHPIPLTPEILEKCGFAYVENIAHWGNGDEDLSYYKLELLSGKEMQVFKDYSCNLMDAEAGCISSLHQLQNLYFALTGEELNMQL